MDERTGEIRQAIEETRARVGDEVEALSYKTASAHGSTTMSTKRRRPSRPRCAARRSRSRARPARLSRPSGGCAR